MGTQEITSNIVYLMGGSFIVGSLFTILLLIVLDMLRRTPPEDPSDDA